MERNLLLLSNSTNAGESYLEWPRTHIKEFFNTSVKRILFIPYAGVGLSPDFDIQKSYDIYESRVSSVFSELGYEIYSIHREADPVLAVSKAEAIAVGGGNTFHLVYMLHKLKIMDAIRGRVLKGVPFIGWSAGSNVACPTMRTTNDMPIIQPESFNCLNLVPFQINPHYLDAHPEGHGGETREQRIQEFMVVNPEVYIAGLREACLLEVRNDKISLKGKHSLRIFKGNNPAYELSSDDDLGFLLKE